MRFFSDGRSAACFAIFLVLIGFSLIYFWPEDLKYTKTSIERAKISEEGRWLEIYGRVEEITQKENGETLKICNDADNCISAYFEGQYSSYYLQDYEVAVRGEVKAVSVNKFLAGHSVEIVR